MTKALSQNGHATNHVAAGYANDSIKGEETRGETARKVAVLYPRYQKSYSDPKDNLHPQSFIKHYYVQG